MSKKKGHRSKNDQRKDYIKANRKGSRDAELENSTGWDAIDKPHKMKTDYNRRPKHKNKDF